MGALANSETDGDAAYQRPIGHGIHELLVREWPVRSSPSTTGPLVQPVTTAPWPLVTLET